MKFIGRSEEIKKLSKEITADEMNFSLIYGRRRIGKSELVKQVLKQSNVKSIYYECKQVAHASNVEGLSEIVSESLNLPPLGYKDIEKLLKFIFQQAKEEKIVLVLDEYSYLRDTIKGMDSILQSVIDDQRRKSKLSLVLLGSYIDVMKSLLERSNPLYGRVDLTISLKPMDYYESSMFYPNYSLEDKVKTYSVFGGIPYYNALIDDTKSVRENIINLVASPGARLENEVLGYLHSEISKIVNANEVFDALARGFTKYSDILSQSHVSSGPTIIDVLDKLIQMEIVERVTPINDHNKKKARYYIKDNLSLFYFRYIFKYSSQISIMDSQVFFDKYIEKEFEEEYVPHQFEMLVKQYLIRQNKLNKINPVFTEIGKYYYDNPKEHTNGEFDVVTVDELGYVFYEVKFRKTPIDGAMIEKEISQVLSTGLNCYKYVFVTKAGCSCQQIENVNFIQLDEMFE